MCACTGPVGTAVGAVCLDSLHEKLTNMTWVRRFGWLFICFFVCLVVYREIKNNTRGALCPILHEGSFSLERTGKNGSRFELDRLIRMSCIPVFIARYRVAVKDALSLNAVGTLIMTCSRSGSNSSTRHGTTATTAVGGVLVESVIVHTRYYHVSLPHTLSLLCAGYEHEGRTL